MLFDSSMRFIVWIAWRSWRNGCLLVRCRSWDCDFYFYCITRAISMFCLARAYHITFNSATRPFFFALIRSASFRLIRFFKKKKVLFYVFPFFGFYESSAWKCFARIGAWTGWKGRMTHVIQSMPTTQIARVKFMAGAGLMKDSRGNFVIISNLRISF